ncbi:MAG: hypothetical protein M3379_03605, partial [Acidobacteriota bacterium]|nr:hypothetical protein [Acidobacteriota bacterium]
MKTRRTLHGAAAYAAPALALLALCLLGPASASAQWTQPDTSSNINSTNSGNVGVGTASPTLKLTVGNPTQQDGRVLVEGADGGSNLLFNTGGNNRARFTTLSNGLHLQSYSSAWARSDFFIRNDGNVGIGTTAPGARLDVGAGASARGGNTDLLLGAGGNLPQLEFFGASKSAVIQYDDAGGMLFYTNGQSQSWTQALYLGNSGWVGVGTSVPSSQLHVRNTSGAGFVRVTGLGGGVLNFEDSSAGQDQKLYQWRSEGGLFRMALSNDASTSLMQQNILVANSSGNVGVGKTPTASYRLDVLGGLNVSDSLCIAGDCKSSWSQLGGQWAAGASGISYGGGNVGVGTASPGERLELYDPSASVRL